MKRLVILWTGFIIVCNLKIVVSQGENGVSDVPEICLPYVPRKETGFEKKCFINAECIFGELLNHTLSDSQTNCLNHCQRTENCKWFTYDPTMGICLTYSECIEFHPTSQCPDCVSGEPDCIKCWIENTRCYGKFIDKVQDCPRINSCKSCISSDILCQGNNTESKTIKALEAPKAMENPFTGSTKLLVATGFGGNSVEIIDLALPKMKCQNLPDFPMGISGAFGTLGFTNKPLICGGVRFIDDGYENTCRTFDNGAWKPAANLNEPRHSAVVTKSEFPNARYKVLVASGNTLEELTNNGWKTVLPNSPSDFSLTSCIRYINSTTLILVNGNPSAYFLNIEKNVWEKITSPKYKRDYFICARIKSNHHTSSNSIIVVGGRSHSFEQYISRTKYLTSTEILDEGSNEWRNGPDLPFGIRNAALVEDPNGGIILVGGSSKKEFHLKTIFRLANAEALWEEMPQKLAKGRTSLVAFLVPEGITNCTATDE